MNRSTAKSLARPSARGAVLATVALTGLVVQIAWLFVLARGAASLTAWLF